MNTEEAVVNEEQLAPLPSYTKLGLARKFATFVVDRQLAASKLSALKHAVDVSTVNIKAAFVEQVLGIDDIDTSDKDSFGELVTEVANTGEAMCRVAQYKVGVVPGERSWIDDKLLKLSMLDAEIPLATIDKIITAATKTVKWGEISIDEIASAKPRAVKGARRGRKKLPAVEPVKPVRMPTTRKTKLLPPKPPRKKAKKGR